MNIGSIGALGGLMAINNLAAPNKSYAAGKPISEENSNNNIADRVKQNLNAEKTSRFDRIEFNAKEIRGEKIEPDEKPDFKAIKLIKSSEIDPPEPPDPTEKSAITERLSVLRERFSNDINLNKTDESNNPPKISVSNDNNISNPASKVKGDPELKSAIKFTEHFKDYTSGEFQRIEKDVRQSAAVRTSEDIMNESTAGRLTPVQSEGIETYQRIQDYANSLNLSNASIAS